MMSKFVFFIAAALVLAPVTAIAKMPEHNGYSHFALTNAEQAQMPNAADKACFRAAAKAPNENARIACNASTSKRINTRLNAAYRVAMTSLPRGKAAALKLEQNAWLARRDKVCASGTAARQMNRKSVSYRAVLSDCGLAELYRRTIWVERYR